MTIVANAPSSTASVLFLGKSKLLTILLSMRYDSGVLFINIARNAFMDAVVSVGTTCVISCECVPRSGSSLSLCMLSGGSQASGEERRFKAVAVAVGPALVHHVERNRGEPDGNCGFAGWRPWVSSVKRLSLQVPAKPMDGSKQARPQSECLAERESLLRTHTLHLRTPAFANATNRLGYDYGLTSANLREQCSRKGGPPTTPARRSRGGVCLVIFTMMVERFGGNSHGISGLV